MTDEEIIKIILDESFKIHKALGPGLLENVYKHCLAYELKKRNLYIEIEKPIPVYYAEVRMDCGYRADIIVEHQVLVETKSIDTITPLNTAQALTYLHFLHIRKALILNFNNVLLKNGIRRVINGFELS